MYFDPQLPSTSARQFVGPVFKNSCARRRLRLGAGLLALDVLVMAAGILAAGGIRFGAVMTADAREMIAVILPVFLLVASLRGAYGHDALASPRFGVREAIGALLTAHLIAAFSFFTLKVGAEFSRLTFFLSGVVCVLALPIARWCYGRFVVRAKLAPLRNEIVLSEGRETQVEAGQVHVEADKLGLVPDASDPIMVERVGMLLKHCERVIIACHRDNRVAWAQMVKASGITAELVTLDLDRVGALGIGENAGSPTLVVSAPPLALVDRISKRLVDIAASGLALLVLALPMLAVALAIKLDSPGPVFFRQRRVGRGGRHFSVLKFRSMRAEATDRGGDRSASRDDDRVTRVGAFIRKTSIDELPQLLNVLGGHMSLVGPRPHALGSRAEDLLFWEADERYWARHSVKPGITGLAQVRGFRGATEQIGDLTGRVQADLEYTRNWSLWRDIVILVATLKVVVHRNAF